MTQNVCALALSLTFLLACSSPRHDDVPAADATGDIAFDAPATDSTDVPLGEDVADAGAPCVSDPDCDDRVFCNGAERCMPGAPGTDARGCVAPSPASPCTAMQMCDETTRRCTGACDTTADADGDGHRSAACGGDDCDDNDANRFPGNPEVCALDSSGARVNPNHDEDCDPTTVSSASTHDGDHDGDGYVDSTCCNGNASGPPTCGDDCADVAVVSPIAPFTTTAFPQYVHPASAEVCNGIDDNCNGRIDEMLPTALYSRDCDGDNFGDHNDPGMTGCSPQQFTACGGHFPVPNNTDCDDASSLVHPGGMEVCNAPAPPVDEDCDGTPDEGCTCTPGMTTACGSPAPGCMMGIETCTTDASGSHWSTCSVTATIITCYVDADGDGFAASGAMTTMACVCPPSTTSRAPSDPSATDCDDANPVAHPGVSETCNGADDNCNGMVDEGLPTSALYRDCDGDGFGDAADGGVVVCGARATSQCMGHDAVADHRDCDDANVAIYPGAVEVCNGIDDNCDGSAAGEDLDNDHYLTPTVMCTGGPRAAYPRTDCNDADPNAHPGATERCNGRDDDCDGRSDTADYDATLACAPDGTQTCNGSTCMVCPGTTRDCIAGSACETDVDHNPMYCGECASSCVGTQCIAGVCRDAKVIFLLGPVAANLGGLTGADNRCQSAAMAAGIRGTFKAFLSTMTQSAASRLGHATIAYRRPDGVLVANNWTDLTDGTIANPIDVDATGRMIPVAAVWTGSSPSGTFAGLDCSAWTSNSSSVSATVGASLATSMQWVSNGAAACATSNVGLYCVEQ